MEIVNSKELHDDESKMTDLVVVAAAKSKPGKEAELLKALLDVAAPTRAQPD